MTEGMIADGTYEANMTLRSFASVDIVRAWDEAFTLWEEGKSASPSDNDLADIAAKFFPEETTTPEWIDRWAAIIETLRINGTPLYTIAWMLTGDFYKGDNAVYWVGPTIKGDYRTHYESRRVAT